MTFNIYIEYTFVDDNGNGNEERGTIRYNVNMEEETFSIDKVKELEFSGAALFGDFHLDYIRDTSGWTALDVSIIKEAVGLD